MNDPLDVAIAAVAARQNGNVTCRQLHALGLSDQMIAYRVRLGRLFRVHRGVYAVGRPPRTPLERAAAAVLACGQGAVLSHASAMCLWGYWKRWDTPFEVSVVRGDPRPKGIRVHRTTTLTRSDIRWQQGIRTTSPARTLLDIAPRPNDKALAKAVNDALYSPFLSQSQLTETLERHPGHPGASRLRPFLDPGDGPTRSDWEREFPAFCERFGLPRPRMAARVGRYTVDALFEAEKLIVELDSWSFHSTRASFESDRDRDADTLAAGHATVRVTWRRIKDMSDREADRLHTILAARRRRAA